MNINECLIDAILAESRRRGQTAIVLLESPAESVIEINEHLVRCHRQGIDWDFGVPMFRIEVAISFFAIPSWIAHEGTGEVRDPMSFSSAAKKVCDYTG